MVVGDENIVDARQGEPEVFEMFLQSSHSDAGVDEQCVCICIQIVAVPAATATKTYEPQHNGKKLCTKIHISLDLAQLLRCI